MFIIKSFPIVLIVLIFTIVVNVNGAATKKQDPKCLLPKDPGPCRMSLGRFYYNAQTDTCEEFTFGGCKGNDNKFGFKETCEQACKISTSTTTVSTATSTTSATASSAIASPTASTGSTTTLEPIQLQLKPSTLKSLTYSSNVTLKMDETITMKITTETPKVVSVKH